MARMTVAEPVTASPPAQTPFLVVRPVSVATSPPQSFVCRPGVVLEMMGFGLVPSAMTTMSHSMTYSEPGMGTGRLRPDLSGSPSSIFTHSRPVTQPLSSPITRNGLVSSELDALFLGVLKFLEPGGHFGAAAAVDDERLLGAKP